MATDAQQDDGPPLTELESLQLKANQVTDESLDSTRRMIQLCEDSRGAGAKTIEMLDHQREQLERVEQGLDNMNAEMKKAEKHLTGMEKWCGLCVCPWSKTAKVKDVDATWGKQESQPTAAAVRSQPGARGAVPDGGSSNTQYIRRINNDAREDEMEENMHVVGGMLGDLKAMAQDMGDEIGKQNKKLDTINDKSAHVDVRINVANKRTEKLLK